ncbi:MAG TPA: ribonuclease HI family protein [Actinobacteria bacterium]|nr:ribonuclease HI family protein [Actinomycetota bacterium]
MITIKTDGAARGNPGPAGIGAVVFNSSGDILREANKYIGEATNNVAEYNALLLGLKMAADHKAGSVVFKLDSELLVKQLNGEYRVKNAALKVLYLAAKKLLGEYQNVRICHVPREENSEADELANEAIERFLAGELEAEKVIDIPGQGSLF